VFTGQDIFIYFVCKSTCEHFIDNDQTIRLNFTDLYIKLSKTEIDKLAHQPDKMIRHHCNNISKFYKTNKLMWSSVSGFCWNGSCFN
jgi:hypothetical protein